eukprot:scaffold1509_cov240-Pinguiococcus_pyrenoidosus.AAC.21
MPKKSQVPRGLRQLNPFAPQVYVRPLWQLSRQQSMEEASVVRRGGKACVQGRFRTAAIPVAVVNVQLRVAVAVSAEDLEIASPADSETAEPSYELFRRVDVAHRDVRVVVAPDIVEDSLAEV